MPYQHTVLILTVTHPINPAYQHILLTHHINPPTHPLNPPYQSNKNVHHDLAGFTFDLRKFESERDKLFKPVEESEIDKSDIKAAFITKYDTLSESEKLKATVTQLAASKVPVESVEENQAGKEKKEGEEENEDDDDHLGEEEEKKDDGPLVYQVT